MARPINTQELLLSTRRHLESEGVDLSADQWRLVENLDMAVPYLSLATTKTRVWQSVPVDAKLRSIRRVLLKLIRSSSDKQDEINEGVSMTVVLLLETARSMAERIDVLEARVRECEAALGEVESR